MKIILTIVQSPLFRGLLLLGVATYLLIKYDNFTEPEMKAHREAERLLNKLASFDPVAADTIAQINNEQTRQAMLIAAHSASGDQRERSTLADMAKEMASTHNLPYRARLAEISSRDDNLKNPEKRKAFFNTYAMACETLNRSLGPSGTSEYLDLLGLAQQSPGVWAKVKDDPMALIVWANTDDESLLDFYHQHRDLLAEPLALLDTSQHDKFNTLSAVLEKLRQHKSVIDPIFGQGQLGVFGLQVILTHGSLIEECTIRHSLSSDEVASVVYLNPDILGTEEGDKAWVKNKGAWLAMIEKQHSTVWLASQVNAFALRLHQDAPSVSNSLLAEYGFDSIQLVIYQHYEDSETVRAAAHAIDKFGDLAIYVFNKYDEPEWIDKIGAYLVDNKIGIRVIPFLIRFGATKGFQKIEDDPGWIDRYYHKNGDPREDANEWIKEIPGGAVLNVCSNWTKGYPNEWSEIGWATFDVADIALTVASFGSSTAVTSSVKVGVKSARTLSGISRQGRRVVKADWIKTVKSAKRGVKSVKPQGWGKLSNAWKATIHYGKIATFPVRAGYRISRTGLRLGGEVVQRIHYGWKNLNPGTKKLIIRGTLAATLYIRLSATTFPNLDNIAQGIGSFIGDLIANAIKLPGEALASAAETLFSELLHEVSNLKKKVFVWIIVLTSALSGVFFIFQWFTTRQRKTRIIS